MSQNHDTGLRGFAAPLSAVQASGTVAWAIAIKSAVPPDKPRELRWLSHPESDFSDGLQSGEIALWMAAISDLQAEAGADRTVLDLAHASAVLEKAEIDRALRFVHDADRRSFVASHAGARLLLGSALNQRPDALQFSQSEFGKPMLLSEAPGLEFSVSHAREAVAVAVANEPIGVDLEPLRELDQLESMSDLILAAEERAILSQAPGALRSRLFLRYWTLKEALVKAAALGFTIPPNTIVIDAGNIPAVVSVPAALEDTAQWQFIAPALDPQLAEWARGTA